MAPLVDSDEDGAANGRVSNNWWPQISGSKDGVHVKGPPKTERAPWESSRRRSPPRRSASAPPASSQRIHGARAGASMSPKPTEGSEERQGKRLLHDPGANRPRRMKKPHANGKPIPRAVGFGMRMGHIPGPSSAALSTSHLC